MWLCTTLVLKVYFINEVVVSTYYSLKCNFQRNIYTAPYERYSPRSIPQSRSINSAVFHIYHVTNWWFQWQSSSVSHEILYLPFAKLFFFFANVSAVNENPPKGGYTLATPPHTATPHRDGADGACARATHQKSATGATLRAFFLSLFSKKKMHWRPRPSVPHVFVKSGIGVEQKLVEWVSSKSVEWRW